MALITTSRLSILQVLQTKFFSHGSIFHAKEKKWSFAWKSILKGRDVIRRGLKWRIGNGYKVRIFYDALLLGSRQGKVISPITEGQAVEMVSSLINHEGMC